MTIFLATMFTVLLLVSVSVLMERAHRRAASLGPRTPWGGDPRRDSDLQRVIHELDSRRWA